MIGRFGGLLAVFVLVLILVACQGDSDPSVAYDPADLLFSGAVALDAVEAITENYPDRASREINNELMAEWLDAIMTEMGWQCISDEWEVVNYSRPLPLQNIVCVLPGQSRDEIVITANYDQSPLTIEGADGNASGMAIMLLLAQILANEQPWPYTMVMVATDGQAYGSLGAQRLINTHPDPERIIAAISLNNLGLNTYDGLGMSASGLGEGYGALWLQQAAQQAARAAGDLWIPGNPSELSQTLVQMLPLAMTDQGPFVAAGVPALALFGQVPETLRDQHREFQDTADDTFDRQSAVTLTQSGQVIEALIRQLQGMDEFPNSFSPYLSYDGGEKIVPPAVFYLLVLALILLFLLASFLSGNNLAGGYLAALKHSLPHYLSIWLPFIASILLLYIFVLVGLLEDFDTYPATPKDPELMNPRWFVIVIWIIALWEFLQIGRRLGSLYMEHRPRPLYGQIRSIVFLVVGLSIFLVSIENPVAAFAFIPVLAWLLIGGRNGWGKALDITLFLVGGIFVYALIYFVGYNIVAVRLVALWYLLLGISVQTIDFVSASILFAMVAAGLALLINPPFASRGDPLEPVGEITNSKTEALDGVGSGEPDQKR